jgi:hypothetical protein
MPTTGKKGRRIYIHSITVTTSGADIAADVGIAVADNGTTIWNGELRSGKVFGGHFAFPAPIPIRAGNCVITVDAGGASVVTVTSVIYEIV